MECQGSITNVANGEGGTGQSCSSAYYGMKAACFDDCLIIKLLLKGFEVNCLK